MESYVVLLRARGEDEDDRNPRGGLPERLGQVERRDFEEPAGFTVFYGVLNFYERVRRVFWQFLGVFWVFYGASRRV